MLRHWAGPVGRLYVDTMTILATEANFNVGARYLYFPFPFPCPCPCPCLCPWRAFFCVCVSVPVRVARLISRCMLQQKIRETGLTATWYSRLCQLVQTMFTQLLWRLWNQLLCNACDGGPLNLNNKSFRPDNLSVRTSWFDSFKFLLDSTFNLRSVNIVSTIFWNLILSKKHFMCHFDSFTLIKYLIRGLLCV
jgi:hypothetical protein